VQCLVFEHNRTESREGEISVLRTNPGESCHGSLSCHSDEFWYVVLLVGREVTNDKDASGTKVVPYIQVLPCEMRVGSSPPVHFVNADAPTWMLSLGPSVREVLCLHACDKTTGVCTVDTKLRTINHAGRLIDGEDFYMYGRKHGYPPRIA
jgi:hypothetical protein